MDWLPEGLFEEIPVCRNGFIDIQDKPGHGMTLARGAMKYKS
jgi:L-alanine-DL-glutamate epimerase-like enolase superfamily enzyme